MIHLSDFSVPLITQSSDNNPAEFFNHRKHFGTGSNVHVSLLARSFHSHLPLSLISSVIIVPTSQHRGFGSVDYIVDDDTPEKG